MPDTPTKRTRAAVPKTVTIKLSPDLARRLNTIVTARLVSPVRIVERALTEWLDRNADADPFEQLRAGHNLVDVETTPGTPAVTVHVLHAIWTPMFTDDEGNTRFKMSGEIGNNHYEATGDTLDAAAKAYHDEAVKLLGTPVRLDVEEAF